MLKEFRNIHPDDDRLQNLEARVKVVYYDTSDEQTKKATLQWIAERNNLSWLHYQYDLSKGEETSTYPSVFDETQIGWEAIISDLKQKFSSLDHIAQERLLHDKVPVTPEQRLQLLTNLAYPDVDGLVPLVRDAMMPHGKINYSHQIANVINKLTLVQLDELMRLVPSIRNDDKFISVYINKLQPTSDVTYKSDKQQQRLYMESLLAFVRRFERHNAHKVTVLYHLLALSCADEVFDMELFREFVKVPKRRSYARAKFAGQAHVATNPVAVGLLPGVNEQVEKALVQKYLIQLARKDQDIFSFKPFLKRKWLYMLFAEAKLIYGQGNTEEYLALLKKGSGKPKEVKKTKGYKQHKKPEERISILLNRVEIEFAPTNPTYFGAKDVVKIDVDLKNIPTLIVKVFEINITNYYKDHQKAVTTDIDLDGLVPHSEQIYSYNDPPMRRERKSFVFPFLEKRGVFVIEFIGGGKSSRCIVRKGNLNAFCTLSPEGHVFEVFDENNNLVEDAAITTLRDSKLYIANDSCKVIVPYSTGGKSCSSHASNQQLLVVDQKDNFVSLCSYFHHLEEYELDAGIYVDREMLLPGKVAQVAVRATLYLNNVTVPLSTVKNSTLDITLVDSEGVESQVKFEKFALHSDKESIARFDVPTALQRVTVLLSVTTASNTLTQSANFSLNSIDTRKEIEEVLLRQDESGYHLFACGKT